MELLLVGLGKMGANIATRLVRAGHTVVGYDPDPEMLQTAVSNGVTPAETLESGIRTLGTPRVVWVMVPAGEATESVLSEVSTLVEPGDTVIDGGNSNYKETQRRGRDLDQKGISFVDCGTSGGVWGLKEGYSLMVGGKKEVVERLSPIFSALAPTPDTGWGHVGPIGSGHFVKMIHNGIEYGMMQAFAEGFELLEGKEAFDLDLHQVSEIWRHGSVVRSWLLDLVSAALKEDASLSDIAGYVSDSGEGRWTVAEAIEQDVPAPVITASLMARFVSRQDESYGAKLLAALRNQFGGHAMKSSGGG
jgi:6-phosphogluconate dehydrogenase